MSDPNADRNFADKITGRKPLSKYTKPPEAPPVTILWACTCGKRNYAHHRHCSCGALKK